VLLRRLLLIDVKARKRLRLCIDFDRFLSASRIRHSSKDNPTLFLFMVLIRRRRTTWVVEYEEETSSTAFILLLNPLLTLIVPSNK